MDVLDFMNMFVEPAKQRVMLWSNDSEKLVFDGYLKDMPTKLTLAEVTSICNLDKPGVIILNIDEID